MNELTSTNNNLMVSLGKQDLSMVTPESYLNSLTPEQIGQVFAQLDSLEKFLSGVRKIIETEVKNGANIPGLQLVLAEPKPTEGLVASDEDVADKLRSMGYTDEQIYKPLSLVSWTNIKNMVKSAGVKELREAGLVGYVHKDPVEKVVYVDPNMLQVEE